MPADCEQAIIGMAKGWDNSHVVLSLVEKNSKGQWVRVLGPYAGRLGKNGLVWGLGLHQNPKNARTKKEGDGRSPAGIFRVGGLWTTTNTPVKRHRSIPEVRVTAADLWVSDVSQPKLYNRYIRLPHAARTPWEIKERMRLNDYPHSIKMLICHNTEETPGRPVVGAGSSIFFHIWRRSGQSATLGCTTMDEKVLRAFIAYLNPKKKPVYILLTNKEYMKYRKDWRLP